MIKRILVIIRRSNGDVLLASPLIQHLHEHYAGAEIDLLVNDDTLGIARALPHVRQIHAYSYGWKKLPLWQRLRAEAGFIRKLFRQYDLAISLTTTDSSVLYALLFGRKSISAVDDEGSKSWWKRRLLDGSYQFDRKRHTVLANLEPLRLLDIPSKQVRVSAVYGHNAAEQVRHKLQALGCNHADFIIFHPSAQYEYKIYPTNLRHALLEKLAGLGVPLVVTGANTPLDRKIKAALPELPNVFDLSGETSLDEYVALSAMSMAYIGGDTLNMHIAAAQDKRVFAIFGPTLLSAWSPWSSVLQCNAAGNKPVQTYGNITVFQADMPCVPCGKAGCENRHGTSDCLYSIAPDTIFAEVKTWLENR